MPAENPLHELRRGVAVLLVGEADMGRVVRAACDALVAGYDGDELRLLAGLSEHADSADSATEDLLFAALSEQGVPLPPRGSEAAVIAVAVAMANEALDGTISARSLAEWTHAYVTHAGPAVLQALVEMDDRYDLVGIVDMDDNLDAETLNEARRLVGSVRA